MVYLLSRLEVDIYNHELQIHVEPVSLTFCAYDFLSNCATHYFCMEYFCLVTVILEINAWLKEANGVYKFMS